MAASSGGGGYVQQADTQPVAPELASNRQAIGYNQRRRGGALLYRPLPVQNVNTSQQVSAAEKERLEIEKQIENRRRSESLRRGVESLIVPIGGISRAVSGTGLIIPGSN